MTKQTKLEARERIAQILGAALKLCSRRGVSYARVTRDDIGREAGIAPTLVTYHMGTMADLRRDIMREAVRVECLPVIAQGLSLGDRHARKIPDALKLRALSSL